MLSNLPVNAHESRSHTLIVADDSDAVKTLGEVYQDDVLSVTLKHGTVKRIGHHLKISAASIKTKFGQLFEIHGSALHCAHSGQTHISVNWLVNNIGMKLPALAISADWCGEFSQCAATTG
jgi:hypothetical protein